MFNTTATIQRPEGTTLTGLDGRPASGIRIKIDQVSVQEQIARQQAYDYHGQYVFKLYTHTWYANSLLRMGDVLIDEEIIDPQTGQPYKYRITGRPKDYFYHHQECHVETVVGQ